MTKRVFSGVQPTGSLHLGNYLGAIKNFTNLQNENAETLYCVVDQHAITVHQDPNDLRNSVRSVAAAFLAAGIDPRNLPSSTNLQYQNMHKWLGF